MHTIPSLVAAAAVACVPPEVNAAITAASVAPAYDRRMLSEHSIKETWSMLCLEFQQHSVAIQRIF
jgi:hypothetical protein